MDMADDHPRSLSLFERSIFAYLTTAIIMTMTIVA